MSELSADAKRRAALGIDVEPFEDAENPTLAAKNGDGRNGGFVQLPKITKPEPRPYGVTGKVTKKINELIDEMTKMTECSRSYIVSEALEALLPAWVEQQKASLGKPK